MPKPALMLLAKLMYLLYKVSLQSDINKMSARNLAIVWSPNLIRHEDMQEDLASMASSTKLVEAMINFQDEIFGDLDE